MSDPKNNVKGVSEAAKRAAALDAGLPMRIWNKLQDLAEPLLKYTDPVKKVCYDHLASHYERKYRAKHPKHHSKVFWFDMGLLAMLSTMLVVWFFADTLLPLIPTPPLARLDAMSPQQIISGADTEYVYAYRNDSPKQLGCVVLRVHLPHGTTLLEDVADADPAQKTCVVDSTSMRQALSENARHDVLVFNLGTLEPNSRDQIRFTARTYGATGDLSLMTAEMTYWDDAATASSRVSTFDERPITGSVFGLNVTMPPNVNRGVGHEIAIAYANNASHPLASSTVRVAVPEDFTVTGATPAFDGVKEWRLGTLPAGATGTLKLRGYFRAVPEKQRVASTFTVRAYVREEGQLSNDLVERVRKNADPNAAALSFEARVAEPAGRDYLLPGETVRLNIRYKNNGTQTISHLKVSLDPGASFINTPDPAALAWNDANAPALTDILPGETGELTAAFTVNDVLTTEDLGTDPFPSLHISTQAEYALTDDADTIVRVDTGTIDLPISTKLGLEAAALYYTKDGDQLGIGPLPPKVGETTKYRVFLTVSTTTSGVHDAVVEATLPPNVTWTGKSSVTTGTAVDYLPTQHKVRWDMGDLPAFANGDATRIGGSFEVALTPTAAEAETAPTLLKNIKISGRDLATNASLHATAPDVSTELPYDKRAVGKGVVFPATPVEPSDENDKQ